MALLTETTLPELVVGHELREEVERLTKPSEPPPCAPEVRPTALLLAVVLSPSTPRPKRR